MTKQTTSETLLRNLCILAAESGRHPVGAAIYTHRVVTSIEIDKALRELCAEGLVDRSDSDSGPGERVWVTGYGFNIAKGLLSDEERSFCMRTMRLEIERDLQGR